jgi:hypothetical protein
VAPSYPSQRLDQFLLRLPDGMRDRIETAARSNNRTMTAEIVSRLQASLDAEKRKPGVRIPKDTPPLSQETVMEIFNEIIKRHTPVVAEGGKADTSSVTELVEKRIGEQLARGLDQIARQIGRLEKRLERLQGPRSKVT